MASDKADEESMLPESELIQAYRQLEAQAARMALLAKDQDWDGLVQEQARYTGAVDHLAVLERAGTLDARDSEKRYAILEHILGHDLEIRSRLVERREELSGLMAVSRRENKLSEAYGVHGVPRSGGAPPVGGKKTP